MGRSIEFVLMAKDRASSVMLKVGSSAQTAGRHVEGMGTKAVAAGTMLGTMAAGGVSALGGMALGALQTGLETAAGMQNAEIAFTTMLGSAKKAKDFIGQLSAFAAKTPFDFPGLQQAASSLVSAGIDAKQVIPIMTTLGDVTSGMGTGAEGIQRATVALQQMQAAQKISGEDLNQLRDAGIPVYDLLASATGKSKAEIVKLAAAGKLGKKELDAMMKALETGKGLERFKGLMDAQSKSLGGLWSTMKDTFSQGMAQVIMPLVPVLQQYLPGAMAATGKALGGLAGGVKVAVEWGGKLKGWLDGLGKSAGSSAFLQQLAKIAGDVGTQIRTVAGPAVENISATIRTEVIPAMVAFGKAMEPVIIWLAQKLAPVVVNVFKGIVTFIQGAVKVIAGIFNVLAGVLTGNWGRAWEGVKQIAVGVWTEIKAIVTTGVKNIGLILGGAIDVLKAIGGRILDGLLSGLRAGWDKVKGFFSDLTDKIPDWKGPAKRDKVLLTPAGKSIMGSLVSGFRAVEPEVASYLQRFTDSIANRKITRAARTAITHIVEDVSDTLRAKTDQLKAIASRIADQKKAIGDLVKARADYAGTLSDAVSGGSITGIGLLQLDDQGRNAAAQQKLVDAQGAQKDAVDALSDAKSRLADLQEQEAARDVSTIAQLQQLRDAREAVTAAEAAAAGASSKLQAAQLGASTATTNQAVDFRDQLQKRYDSIKAFWVNLQKLRSEGLSSNVLQEIAQAGLEQGGALANALVQGTPETIRQINDLAGQIDRTSDAFGAKWSGQMYDTGIQAAEGLLRGLQSQQSVLEQAVTKLGAQLVASIRKSLGIKSPSRVFADEVGAHIPTGIAKGIRDGAGHVEDALATVVPIRAGGARGVSTSTAAAGGGTVILNVTINAGQPISTATDIARALEKVVQDASRSGVKVNLSTKAG